MKQANKVIRTCPCQRCNNVTGIAVLPDKNRNVQNLPSICMLFPSIINHRGKGTGKAWIILVYHQRQPDNKWYEKPFLASWCALKPKRISSAGQSLPPLLRGQFHTAQLQAQRQQQPGSHLQPLICRSTARRSCLLGNYKGPHHEATGWGVKLTD